MAVELKSRDELKTMREAGRITAEVLDLLGRAVRPGLVVRELDEIVREEYARRGVYPTFLNYPPGGAHPFPATVCVSINDQIVHGIPGNRVLKDGDVVSIDLGATYNPRVRSCPENWQTEGRTFRGFVGDTAITVPCGKVSPEALRLIETTKGALWEGIRASRKNATLGDVGWAVQHYAESRGFYVVRQYVGHGVGRKMHEEPQVPNYGEPGTGRPLEEGLVIAIEPMLNIGTADTYVDPDYWTVYTADGSLSAHFEHTIAITDGEAEVLTLP